MNEQSAKFVIPPMPEPVEVWIYRDYDSSIWLPSRVKVGPLCAQVCEDKPYKIIRGMMSLDELAEHGLFIGHVSFPDPDPEPWYVIGPQVLPGKAPRKTFKFASGAQWAATYIAESSKEVKS